MTLMLRAILLALLITAPLSAHAQTSYPDRTVRLIVSASAGGGTDIIARLVGQQLNGLWGVPVIVENNTGGAGNVSARLVARAPADGYTLFATFGGVLTITGLYLLVNAAMLHVLTPAQIAESKLPAADAAAVVFGDASGLVVTLLALLSVAAIANLTLMFLTRIGHAMARDGALPAVVGTVAAKGTPTVALALTALGSAALASTGGYERLVAIGTPTALVINGVIDAAAIAMRHREPDLHRPYRMPLFPLPALVGLLINLALLAALFYDAPLNSSTGLGLVALVGLAYGLRALFRPRPAPAE
jgi:amino acid transporter